MNNFVIDNMIGLDPRFKAILDMPDEEFEKSFDKVKEAYDTIFNSPGVKEATFNSAKSIPNYSREECEKSAQEIIEQIKSADGISDIKKEFLIEIITKSANLTMEYAENPRERIDVKVYKLNPDAILPTYAYPTDAGADVAAVEEIKIEAGETKLVKTGLAVAIPAGYMIQIYPRSGLSAKTGLRIANSVGIIDHLYHQEIKVIITNTGKDDYIIKKGDRIAQMLITPTPMINFKVVEEPLDETTRGGFGSTGI